MLRVHDAGFKAHYYLRRVQESRFGVGVLGFLVCWPGFVFRVQVQDFKVQGLRQEDAGLRGISGPGLGFKVQDPTFYFC